MSDVSVLAYQAAAAAVNELKGMVGGMLDPIGAYREMLPQAQTIGDFTKLDGRVLNYSDAPELFMALGLPQYAAGHIFNPVQGPYTGISNIADSGDGHIYVTSSTWVGAESVYSTTVLKYTKDATPVAAGSMSFGKNASQHTNQVYRLGADTYFRFAGKWNKVTFSTGGSTKEELAVDAAVHAMYGTPEMSVPGEFIIQRPDSAAVAEYRITRDLQTVELVQATLDGAPFITQSVTGRRIVKHGSQYLHLHLKADPDDSANAIAVLSLSANAIDWTTAYSFKFMGVTANAGVELAVKGTKVYVTALGRVAIVDNFTTHRTTEKLHANVGIGKLRRAPEGMILFSGTTHLYTVDDFATVEAFTTTNPVKNMLDDSLHYGTTNDNYILRMDIVKGDESTLTLPTVEGKYVKIR